MLNRFLLPEWRADPELARRARLIVRFGFLGFFFGTAYAIFYLAIGHLWGAAIIILSSLGFGAMPWILRKSGRLALAGNGLAAIMTAGFAGLCCVEGGLHGHAVAWLASVPLCALLLVDGNAARVWVSICFIVCAAMIGAELAHIAIPNTYDPRWHSLVNSAGYLGLIVFMFVLGLIFENGRKRAFTRMQVALDQLATSHAELVILNREKTEFLAIAAHDLRNPLTTIVSYAQLLQSESSPEDVLTFSKAISAAGTRMRDLLKKLLDASAIEEGRFTCTIERCEVSDLITESLAHNRMHAEQKGIELVIETAADLAVRADHSTTVQVLDNLVSNAIKYSPLHTTVRVHVTPENGSVIIAVTDEGPGISVDDQKKLFRKFVRLSARPTAGESSTGLGLSIVRKLVEAMSGTIECRSELGRGSTFLLHLPAWDAAESNKTEYSHTSVGARV